MPGASDFVGEWQVGRVITDRLGLSSGVFQGIARLEPRPGGLGYAEEGVLRLGSGAVLRAGRSYLWDFEAGVVRVRFDDGRAFHDFVPEGQGAGTDHLCGADLYRVRYDFRAFPVWTAAWEVRGPRKDHALVTTYRRG